jgi:hypothetical protein
MNAIATFTFEAREASVGLSPEDARSLPDRNAVVGFVTAHRTLNHTE